MKVKIDVDAFKRAMDSYSARKLAQLERATKKACAEVEASAKEKCPSGSSNDLRNSISYKVEDEGARFIGVVGSPIDYAPYVHEGTGIYSRTGMGRQDVPWTYMDENGQYHSTSGMEPTPFLEEARNEKKGRIFQIFLEALKG